MGYRDLDNIKDAVVEKYSTAWISNATWNNNKIDITHNLGVPLTQLLVLVFLSVDATEPADDNDCVLLPHGLVDDVTNNGHQIYGLSDNSIRLQTGATGIYYIDTSGGDSKPTNGITRWYKVIIYRFL